MIDELLKPLRAEPPTDAEIQRLLATADRRTRRRRVRLAGGALLATATVTAALAAVPSTTTHTPLPAPEPATAATILRSAARTAAEQAAPPPWAGYRYVQSVDRREDPAGYTIERTEEEWNDSHWQGRMISTAKLISGTIKLPDPPPGVKVRTTERSFAESLLAPRDISTPGDMPNLYGDGPLAQAPLSELPTDPAQLADLLLKAHKDGRWTPGGGWDPAPDSMHYDVLRDILLLLTLANTTPDQRAALITVLGNYEGVTALPQVQDRRGRVGRGVEIAVGEQAPVRVIFSPGTSELLEWSQGGETHTFLRSGHVAKIGDRP